MDRADRIRMAQLARAVRRINLPVAVSETRIAAAPAAAPRVAATAPPTPTVRRIAAVAAATPIPPPADIPAVADMAAFTRISQKQFLTAAPSNRGRGASGRNRALMTDPEKDDDERIL